jgi:aryl-alcohol dehydrogenase-like predicted oxidoreductase
MSFSGNYGEANDEDTAQVYGQGHNETLIGRFLSENPGAREKVFIGSKCGFTVRFICPP